MADKRPSEKTTTDLWKEIDHVAEFGDPLPPIDLLHLRLLEQLVVAVEGLDEAVRSLELGTVVVETAEEVRRRG